jgi:hypothetical protein
LPYSAASVPLTVDGAKARYQFAGPGAMGADCFGVCCGQSGMVSKAAAAAHARGWMH